MDFAYRQLGQFVLISFYQEGNEKYTNTFKAFIFDCCENYPGKLQIQN